MGIGEGLLWAYVLAFGGYSLILLTGALLAPRPGTGSRASDRRLSLGIVVPAYNEMAHLKCIAASISMAREIGAPMVVVDDGSIDGSSGILPGLCTSGGTHLVRHAANRGKAAALNTGIEALNTDLVLTLDADTTVTAGAVKDAASLFASPIGAVALRVDGTGASPLARAQSIEYLDVLNFKRAALARFGIVFTIPGAASLWRRSALAETGGFRSRTCAEDTDATISLSLAGWRLAIAPGSRAVTECPLGMAALLRQRSRWIWGTIQAAVFALLHLATNRPRRNTTNAMMFVFMTALDISGFLLPVSIAWRLAARELGWGDVIAGSVLAVTILIRLALVNRWQGGASGSVFKVLACLITMQIANTAAFWYGLMKGRAGRISW